MKSVRSIKHGNSDMDAGGWTWKVERIVTWCIGEYKRERWERVKGDVEKYMGRGDGMFDVVCGRGE
jgi:hypothetical protein